MTPEELSEHAAALPREPGVYQFLDGDRVVYVGKAVDLRDRVRSYRYPRGERIARMVERADGLDFAVTETETQALLLEANLIKRHAPRYNVRLRDDKSYPLVQFTDHPVPRVEVVRDPAEGATAYGPYTDVGRVETVLKAVRETFGLRGCSEHKYSGRERPCLDYDLGLCAAPCTDEIDTADYREAVERAKRFFEGETGALAEPLRERMEAAAAEQAFERAANLRDRLDAVETFHEGGAAVAGDDGTRTVDVLGAATEGAEATVARLRSEGGSLVERDRHRLAGDIDDAAAALAAFVPQFYAERELPDALRLSDDPADPDLRRWLDAEGVDATVPGAGREGRLVDLALKNARRRGGREDEAAALAEAVGIDRPERVEGFDVSHASGSGAVGSDVTFVGGEPETADYRRTRLPGRNDDYANMRALVGWRAERAVEGRDDRPDPDLLLVDGGEGQLGAARDALADHGWSVPVLALAKEEEVVHSADRVYDWPDEAPQLHLLQRVRDEAHRFAVRYHRTVRDEVSTVLDEVEGVGPERRKRLLRRFGSVEGVRGASVMELADVEGIGEATAETIANRL